MNLELESDMKAACLLGCPVVRDESGVYPESESGSGTRATNIQFTLSDLATRDAVVQMLLNKGIYIRKISGVFEWVNDNNSLIASGFDEYIEVVRHAIMEVKDE